MKYILFFITSLFFLTISAQTVEYYEEAESFLNSLESGESTAVNSCFKERADSPESFTDSWTETPEYIYVKSEHNTSSVIIVSRLENLLTGEYETKYNENAGKITRNLKKFSKTALENYPEKSRESELEQEFIIKANELVNKIPEISDNLMFDGIAMETTDSLSKADGIPRITEIRVYYRRIMDGAVLIDGTIPVKMVFDTASGVIKKMEVNWIDYESIPNLNSFERYEAGFESVNIRSSFESGRTSVGVYGEEVFDSIYVYTVEKIWKKKICESGEILIPALRFFIKVRSEDGIKSIPEYFDAGVKEAVFKPIYELMENPLCR